MMLVISMLPYGCGVLSKLVAVHARYSPDIATSARSIVTAVHDRRRGADDSSCREDSRSSANSGRRSPHWLC